MSIFKSPMAKFNNLNIKLLETKLFGHQTSYPGQLAANNVANQVNELCQRRLKQLDPQ